MTAERVVGLLELLRAYAEVYARSMYYLGMNMHALAEQVRLDDIEQDVVLDKLTKLHEECKRSGLQMTALLLEQETPNFWSDNREKLGLVHSVDHIAQTLQNELSLQFFFKLDANQRKLFEDPIHRWEAICLRFEPAIRDVEEMNKCFALQRYTAAMFHALHVAELGAIELGGYLRVTDPKKGWGPTERQLGELVKGGHSKLPRYLKGRFEFLEQVHREIESMMLAWRHKVDHAANHLFIVPNSDFTPDVAEHIIGSVRMFMLRLQEGLPTSEKKKK